ncbi:MAG: DMT family transporter [Oscillospiraceae bacterium]
MLYFPCEQYGLRLTSTSFSGVMVALIPLCSLIYGAVFLHEKATRRQVAVLGSLRRGGDRAGRLRHRHRRGEFSRLSCPARHGLCRCGLYGSLPRLLGQLYRLRAHVHHAAVWAPPRSACCPCSSTGTT